MPDLDALRAQGWDGRPLVWDESSELWGASVVRGAEWVGVEHPDHAVAEAMLLAACDRADGLPTERERDLLYVLRETVRRLNSPNRLHEYVKGIHRSDCQGCELLADLRSALDRLTPTKEAPGDAE